MRSSEPLAHPQLSVLIPTFERAEFLRALVSRLAIQISAVPAGSVELVVSDNQSVDHTAAVLDGLSGAHPWMRVVRPPQHLRTAEENVFFGLQHCAGEYVWTFGDDDEPTDGAIGRIQALLTAHDPDLLMFNVATMAEDGGLTRSRLLPMHAEALDWPIHRIVGAVGIMALSACITAVVARRRRLLTADWAGHFRRATIYAHVVAYLEAFKDARCLLLDEAPAIARHATGVAEFTRLAEASGRYVNWPWTIGLPRHLAWMVRSGAVQGDWPSCVFEFEGEGRGRLLPHILALLARQLQLWAESGDVTYALQPDDIENYVVILAGAPLEEREITRGLLGLAQVVASMHRGAGAFEAKAAFSLLQKPERQALSASFRQHYAEATGGRSGDADAILADVFDAGGADRRNADPASQTSHRASLQATLEQRSTLDEGVVAAALTRALVDRLGVLRSELIADPLEAGRAGGLTRLGLQTVGLGGVYVAFPATRALAPHEREDLSFVDPLGVGDVLVAADAADLETRLAGLSAETMSGPVFDETFLDWRLGSWRGRQVAIPADAPDLAFALTTARDRLALRRRVVKSRRETEPSLVSPALARQRARPATDLERRLATGFFDEAWYLQTYASARALVDGLSFQSGFDHWINLGGRFGLNPTLWFDSDDYLAENPSAAATLLDGKYPSCLHHYLVEGAGRSARPFALFDPIFYVATNPDAQAALTRGITPLEHFLSTGLEEDRPISTAFDSAAYLLANPDVAQAVERGETPSALVHYMLFGRLEGRAGGARVRGRGA